MRYKIRIAAAFLLATIAPATPLFAQAPPASAAAAHAAPMTAQQLAAAIDPFLTDQSPGVLHIATDQIDLDALGTFISDAFQKAGGQADQARQITANLAMGKPVLSRIREVGIHDVIMTVDLSLLMSNQQPCTIVIPLQAGADEKAITLMVEDFKGTLPLDDRTAEIKRVGDSVVLAAPETLQHAATLTGKPLTPRGQAIAQALTALGTHAIDAIIAPTPDSRRVVRELLPALPTEIGGGSTEALSQALYLGITLKAPPEPLLLLRAQADSTPHAAQFLALWHSLGQFALSQIDENSPPAQARQERAMVEPILKRLEPQLQNDALVLRIDGAAVTQIASDLLPAVERASEASRRVGSASVERQLLMLGFEYAAEHGDAWPEKFDVATLGKLGLHEEMLKNPRHPDKDPGFIYLQPANLKTNKHPEELIVLYENVDDSDDGRNAGFADGHVEWMTNKAFKEALAKQK